MKKTNVDANTTLTGRQVLQTWWPLAASWLLMGLEGPSISSAIARLANPEINLAAYGGIVFPLALIIEAPVIMLLSASTALSRDRASYQNIYRFMMITSALLTGLHVLVAFTPLYDFVARQVLGVPAEIIEPGRIGLRLMTPWTWAIGYRRFQQGVLIRYGYSRAVGTGTLIRLVTLAGGLLAGYSLGDLPGIVVGTAAQSLAVTAEAVYAGWRVQPVLRNEVFLQPQAEELSWRSFFDFYLPLVLTSFLSLIWNPIGSASVSRMANPLDSLAAWPVVTGFMFLLRASGLAFNEVVVALLGRTGAYPALARFTGRLTAILALIHLTVAATPLATLWFQSVTALNPRLVEIARVGLWLGIPLTLSSALQSWFQGSLLYAKRTRGIPESVVVFFLTLVVVLGMGIANGQITGLFVGITAFSLGMATQTAWLFLRSRPVMRAIRIPGGSATEEFPDTARR